MSLGGFLDRIITSLKEAWAGRVTASNGARERACCVLGALAVLSPGVCDGLVGAPGGGDGAVKELVAALSKPFGQVKHAVEALTRISVPQALHADIAAALRNLLRHKPVFAAKMCGRGAPLAEDGELRGEVAVACLEALRGGGSGPREQTLEGAVGLSFIARASDPWLEEAIGALEGICHDGSLGWKAEVAPAALGRIALEVDEVRPRAVAVLKQALTAELVLVRTEAACALAGIAAAVTPLRDEAAGALARALREDDSVSVRLTIAMALFGQDAGLGSEDARGDAVAFCIDTLRGAGDLWDRRGAARVLAKIAPTGALRDQAAAALTEAWRTDEHEAVRFAALGAAAACGAGVVDATAIASCAQALRYNGSHHARIEAAWALGCCGSAGSATSALLRASRWDDAATWRGRRGGEEARHRRRRGARASKHSLRLGRSASWRGALRDAAHPPAVSVANAHPSKLRAEGQRREASIRAPHPARSGGVFGWPPREQASGGASTRALPRVRRGGRRIPPSRPHVGGARRRLRRQVAALGAGRLRGRPVVSRL